jgi:hypothetical protein
MSDSAFHYDRYWGHVRVSNPHYNAGPSSSSVCIYSGVGTGHLNYHPVHRITDQKIQALRNRVASARLLAMKTAFGMAHLKYD